jgi:hypothetical protein
MSVETAGGSAAPIAQLDGISNGPFDVDDQAAYVATMDSIVRVPLDGSAPVPLASGLPSPSQPQLVPGGDLVFRLGTTSGFGIARMPVTGGQPVLIHDGIRVAAGVMLVDDGAVYAAYCCGDSGSVSGGAVLRLDL